MSMATKDTRLTVMAGSGSVQLGLALAPRPTDLEGSIPLNTRVIRVAPVFFCHVLGRC
jgi:hypothetical protein